jgi:endonuclease-3
LKPASGKSGGNIANKGTRPTSGKDGQIWGTKSPHNTQKRAAATPVSPKAKTAAPHGKAGGKAPKGYNPVAPERVAEILKRLDATYPGVTCALQHRTAWELLVATILSAQCTDVRVNMVTPELFRKYPTLEDFARLKPEEIEPDIRSTGFFRNKSKSLVGAAKKILSDFDGKVPGEMDQLLTIPGVARKTANVVLGTWFKKNVGVVVDTHVQRITRRLELTSNLEPGKIEQDLMRVIPQAKWTDFSHQIIWHGRKLCVARSPKCVECPLENICHSADKTWSTVEVHRGAKG